jgi:D-xylose transport system permease protein
MVVALAIVWIVFAYATDGLFLDSRNISNLMRQTAVTAILAVGMLMVIVTGHIDLSVGSLVGLAGMIGALMQARFQWGLVESVSAAIGLSLVVGAVQGALVAYARIPAFIVTLGGLHVWRGIVKAVSAGNTIPISLPSFKAIGQEYVATSGGAAIAAAAILGIVWWSVQDHRSRRRHGLASRPLALTIGLTTALCAVVVILVRTLNAYAGVPLPVLILFAVALCGGFVMQHTVFGRYLYAIGGNVDAARLSGINLQRHVLGCFCLMGALAGVAAVIYTARVGSASPDAGTLLELDAIAACVIGGASLMGGRGTVFGACLGALFMVSLDNGMSLENVPDFMQDIVKGAILVAAVGLDMIGRKR